MEALKEYASIEKGTFEATKPTECPFSLLKIEQQTNRIFDQIF